jgi:riboflavin synthase
LTTIGFKNKGDRVNIETDMIGKYVERFMGGIPDRSKENSSKQAFIDHAYLVKTGFID